MRIDEILIQVSDVERSLRFYRDGLGLPFAPSRSGDDSYEATLGETRIVIHPDFDESPKSATRGAG